MSRKHFFHIYASLGRDVWGHATSSLQVEMALLPKLFCHLVKYNLAHAFSELASLLALRANPNQKAKHRFFEFVKPSGVACWPYKETTLLQLHEKP